MKRASQVMSTMGLLMAVGAAARLVNNGTLGAEGAWGVVVIGTPVFLSAIGLRAALSGRPGLLWIVGGALLAFVVLAAFSVGPHFWAATGATLIAASLLQSDSRPGNASPRQDTR